MVDLDAVVVPARSGEQVAAATWKKTPGRDPLTGFADRGSPGPGEPVAARLRPGIARCRAAAGRVTATRVALARFAKRYRRGRATLVRAHGAGGTRGFVGRPARCGRWLS